MRYYLFFNNQQIGPMTREQLKFYNVNADSQVRDENTADWRALLFYPELMELYGPQANAKTTPPVSPQSFQPYQPNTYTIDPPRGYKKGSNAWIWWIVGIIVVVPVLLTIIYVLLFVLATL